MFNLIDYEWFGRVIVSVIEIALFVGIGVLIMQTDLFQMRSVANKVFKMDIKKVLKMDLWPGKNIG